MLINILLMLIAVMITAVGVEEVVLWLDRRNDDRA